MLSNDSLNEMMRTDIANLEDKRKILQQIVEITKAIESMQESLNAVMVLGVPSKEMPERALQLYSALSDSLRNLPVKQIKLYYDNLESVIKRTLDKILAFSDQDLSSDEGIEFITLSSTAHEESPLDLLDEFKRTAQTAVSLRVLLRKRGVQTPGATIPVSREVISRKLQDLDRQEKSQRDKAQSKIQEMQDDVQKMLANPSYPHAMKDILKGVVSNLERDKKLLRAGVPLNKLSFAMETHEIAGVEEISVEEEIEIVGLPEDDADMSFSDAASRWLNSPWEVSWKDIATQKK
ncbi:MAG: hypothetical protein ABW068_11230 [Candidatus Thiodiazotropha sp.]